MEDYGFKGSKTDKANRCGFTAYRILLLPLDRTEVEKGTQIRSQQATSHEGIFQNA
jgi:hypothetical protein